MESMKKDKFPKDIMNVVKEKRKSNKNSRQNLSEIKIEKGPNNSKNFHQLPVNKINIEEYKSDKSSTIIQKHTVILENENFSDDNISYNNSSELTLPSRIFSEPSPISMDSLEEESWFLSVDSGLDETTSEDDKLKLLNSRLESTLHSLGSEARKWLQDRSELVGEVSALRAHLTSSRITCEEAIKRAESLTSELISSKKRFEYHITHLNQTINEKTLSIKQLTKNLNQLKEDHINLSLKIQKYDSNSSEKSQVSHMLKQKITDLCLEINQLKSTQTASVEIESELRREIENLQKTKQRFSDQLNISKASQERLSKELLQMKEFLQEGSLHNHKLSHENTCLQSQVICLRTSLLEAKRNISKQLDAIKNEMVEREALFASLRKEKTSFEDALRMKTISLNESEATANSLNHQIQSQMEELSQIRAAKEKSCQELYDAHVEREHLREQINQHENYLKEYAVVIENTKKAEAQIQLQYNQLSANSAADKALLEEVEKEKFNLSQTIQTMMNEKKVLTDYSDNLKGQLDELNRRLEDCLMQINQRNTEVTKLEATITQISQENETIKMNLDEKQQIINQLHLEKTSLESILKTTQAENFRLSEELVKSLADLEVVRKTITSEYENKIINLQEKNQANVDELTRQLNALISDVDGMREEIGQLLIVKRDYQELIEKYNTLESDHKMVLAQHEDDLSRLQAERTTSVETLRRYQAETDAQIQEQNNQILSYTQRTTTLETEIARLTGEIESIQRLHTAAMSDAKMKWEKLLGELRDDLETTKQSHLETTRELERLRNESQQKEVTYSQQIAEHMKALSVLEMRLSIIPELEGKQRQLMCELEVFRGKEQGLKQNYKTLKSHTNDLEQRIAEKEELIAKMLHENEVKSREILVAKQTISNLTNSDIIISSSTSTSSALLLSQEILEETVVTSSNTHNTLLENDQVIRQTVNMSYQTSPGQNDDLYQMEEELERLRCERDRSNDSLCEMNREFSETLAKLTILENAYENLEKLLGEMQTTNANHLTAKRQIQIQLDERILEYQSLQEKYQEICKLLDLECRKTATLEYERAQICQHHSDELQSLRKIIETATNHLKNVNKELEVTRREKVRSETFLAQIRGSLLAIVERHRSRMNVGETVNSETISMNIRDIEVLLGDDQLAKESYLFTKPLSSINKVFQDLNTEIDQLESELIDHTVIVHESVHHWKSTEKFIATNISHAQVSSKQDKLQEKPSHSDCFVLQPNV